MTARTLVTWTVARWMKSGGGWTWPTRSRGVGGMFPRSLRGKILCPIFAQESSRTFMNSTTGFQKMGGTVSPLNFSNTRFGSN